MKVKIYTTPTCPFCYQAKEYLSAHNISYEEIDVSNDVKTIKEFIAKTGQTGVPVIEVEGNYIFGFDKLKINAIFNI